MGKKHIDRNERLAIEKLFNARMSVAEIARYMGRCRQTIYNELKRGYYEHTTTELTTKRGYSAQLAQDRHDFNGTAKGAPLKIGNNYELAAKLEYLIADERRSPYDALCVVGMPFCVTTLYSYIDKGIFQRVTNKDLWVKSRQKKRGYRKVAKNAPRGTSIEKRPKHINNREDFGHWEMDSVIGKQTDNNALLVLTERQTRAELVFLLPDKTAGSVDSVINRLRRVHGFNKAFKSITMDNGSEFSHERIIMGDNEHTQIDTYYCHPYSAYERGSNENNNKNIRKYFPKGQSLASARVNDCRFATRRINGMHRKLFKGQTAEQVFNSVSPVPLEAFYSP